MDDLYRKVDLAVKRQSVLIAQLDGMAVLSVVIPEVIVKNVTRRICWKEIMKNHVLGAIPGCTIALNVSTKRPAHCVDPIVSYADSMIKRKMKYLKRRTILNLMTFEHTRKR